MSMFNTVVPPHPISSILLRAINWAQPDDPEKKYPLLGRMRYVWVDEEKNIKLLLKDGPSSWSEEQEAIMSQIKGHETLVNVEVLDRDPVYVVATFKPIMETSYDRSIPMDELLENLFLFDETAMSNGWPSILKHPFDLFDIAMEKMKNGEMSPKMERLAENIKNMLGESDAEDKLEDITKEAGVGFEKTRVKVMMVDPVGNLEDKTEEFMKKNDNEKSAGESTQ
jgi:translation elongation factor EF-1beta